MALLGRPKLGDTVRTQLRVKESKEFKVITKIHVLFSNFKVFWIIL